MKIASFLMVIGAYGAKNGQCGTELTQAQSDECKAKKPNWAPPMCNPESHACQQASNDICSYSCVAIPECEGKIEKTLLGKDGYVCNCVKKNPERYEFVWSCDNKPISGEASETQHQYGFARIPDINRDPNMNDNRNITILHKDHKADLLAGFKKDNSIDFFSKSQDTCQGTIKTSPDPDNLVFYEFSNIFNHPECAAECEYEKRNNTLHQVCTTLIGYDDLLYTFPDSDQTAKIQSGEFWQLSCSTKLEGEVSADAVVRDVDNGKTTEEGDGKDIEFSLKIMCCDPEAPDCEDCTTEDDKVPIIKIGPKSKADSRFYIEAKMNTNDWDMGYFHLEKAIYQSYDHDGKLLNAPKIPLIEDGCNLNPLIQFKARTAKQSEGFYLTPFKLEGGKFADEFKITADVSACPLGPFGDQCGFKSDCATSRYDGLDWYPNPNDVVVGRRRRATVINQAQIKSTTKIVDIYHPCKLVTEEISMCFNDKNGNPDCWTKDLCDRRRNGQEIEVSSSATTDALPTLAVILVYFGLF